jgi:ketosteroid isomerase-like protein
MGRSVRPCDEFRLPDWSLFTYPMDEEGNVPEDHDRLQVARDCYGAYVSGDRSVVERCLTDDYVFYSPADVGIDRAKYFERCWPNAELIKAFRFERLIEIGDEVLVTYESTKTDGRRFRNTEILTFAGEKICRVEVYFGWDLD